MAKGYWLAQYLSIRDPERIARAPSKMLLPAPVSPVTAVNPHSKFSSTSSIRARFLIFRYCNIFVCFIKQLKPFWQSKVIYKNVSEG